MKKWFFQLALSLGSFFINLYCILAEAFKKEMHKLDYYLVLLQSTFDFLFSGIYNSVFASLMTVNQFNSLCANKQEVDYATNAFHENDHCPRPPQYPKYTQTSVSDLWKRWIEVQLFISNRCTWNRKPIQITKTKRSDPGWRVRRYLSMFVEHG